ncbi:hypothetical protein SAY86_008727 [Trapa natans]|uniref:Uncharacterized protein n=1 Tax=Trapa natans TaxID=22666 RepID=A0AAN7KDD9_TRANT|nr:hypothetical protein SAY86_008727 [Trapa natans]
MGCKQRKVGEGKLFAGRQDHLPRRVPIYAGPNLCGSQSMRVPLESHVAPTIERILSPMNKDTSETAGKKERRDGMQPLLEKEVWEVGEKERIQWRAGIYTDAIWTNG